MSVQVKQLQLRGQPAKATTKRVKVFIYGAAGSGKSYFCTQFPKPYYIDTEKGVECSKYINNIETNQGVVFQTRSFKELYQEIKTLSMVKHDYQTLVIDPITPVYNNLVDDCLAKIGGKEGFGRHYQEAAKHFQKLIDLLLAIDMNVILTAHSKDKYGADMSVIGTTYDAYKKIDFLFDVVIEAVTRGKKYVGISKKSRIISLEPNQEFNFTFDEFSSLYKKELESFESNPIHDNEQVANSLHIVYEVKDNINDPINSKDLEILKEMIKESNTDEMDICTYLKIECIGEMRQSQLPAIMRMLNKKLDKMNKGEASE